MTAMLAGLPASLTLVGAGKMGGAMLERLARGRPRSRIATTLIDPAPAPEIAALCAARGLGLNPAAPPVSEAVVLAIKPQGLDAAAPALDALLGPDTLLVSILAGKTIADLGSGCPPPAPSCAPCRTCRRASAAAPPERPRTRRCRAGQRGRAQALLTATGARRVARGRGSDRRGHGRLRLRAGLRLPARRSLGRGRRSRRACRPRSRRGSPAPPWQDRARSSTRARVAADQLRRDVTSPGGTTAAALAVLMRADGMPALLREAVAAAKRRAGELSG